ncbi:tetratricopeptide repeat protein (macronuclear) [Tetrahymena thermophila SB210]|uniref:histidine kinase n=1 Tax=Tetrahymena thermophila (strain SB210) TaxID=312017 RepID=Q22MS6_TETTS|nr:tetratricopeptide repeat protein [Tetrahymena thermophila SB210]EAR86532.1 tetratricopeptide repeat protein [Tetrahymena thermophila SB210]|eukprot:XP_976944.1 tetratricopeptide repeat protein [Tetrahymena thermophila SB210]
MKQQLIELEDQKQSSLYVKKQKQDNVVIDIEKLQKKQKQIEFSLDSSKNGLNQLDSDNQQNTMLQTQKNIDSKKKMSSNSNDSQINQPGKKSWDRLKLKIVCIILFFLLSGIVFTGVMNYFLAILLSDHISETTTEEIGKVQIDFTRAMGLHYGNAYINLIQQETDKSQKVYKQLLSIFNQKNTNPNADFTKIAVHLALFNPSAMKDPQSNVYSSLLKYDLGQIIWIYPYQPTLTTILPGFDSYIYQITLGLFGMLRAVKTDVDLYNINIVLFEGPNQLLFSFPAQADNPSSPLTQNALLANGATKQIYQLNQSRFFFTYQVQTFLTKEVIIVTDCIALICGELQINYQEYCITNPSDPRCSQYNPSDFCGSVCTNYIKFTLSFLQSLQGKGIDHVYVTQVSQINTPTELYKPLVYLDFQTMSVKQNFWKTEFNVPWYDQSADAQNFYNQFNKFYSDYTNDYLATSSYQNGNDQYQISIFSIKQKLNSAISTNQGNIAFTAITKIPQSSSIFQSTITDIKQSMSQLLIIGIVVLIILCVFIIYYIYQYSDHVTQPINLLKDKVKEIANRSLYVNVRNDTDKHWQEIDQLYKNFDFLNQIIVYGDDKYYDGLTAETLIKYSNAFLMFEKLDNRKGMGIVLNNMGNINMKLGRIEEAISSYKQAFQLAERDLMELLLVENIFSFYKVRPFNGYESLKPYDYTYNYHFYNQFKSRKESKDPILVCTANKHLYEQVIANRSYQLASAYLQGYYISTNQQTKQEYLSNCIDYLRLTERLDGKDKSRYIFNILKIVQAHIEKAIYYLQQNDKNNQFIMLKEAFKKLYLAENSLTNYRQKYELFNENFKNDIPPEIVEQHLKLQSGLFFKQIFYYKKSLESFNECLRIGRTYDPAVREQCLKNIKEILEQENLIDQAPGLLKLIKNNFEKKWKDIVIIADFSYSMRHKVIGSEENELDADDTDEDESGKTENKEKIGSNKNQRQARSQKYIAVKKFLQIFDNYVQNDDRVAFIKFNENVDVIFELNEKENNTIFLRNSIKSFLKICPEGESAVRQAIYTAIKLFQKAVPKDHSKWIVIFTDGGDSCSKISEPELMQMLSQSDVNIMIIGCGLDKYATKIFRQYCEKTKNGIFIKTNNKKEEIDIAFQAITNKIYGNSDLNYNVEAFNAQS